MSSITDATDKYWKAEKLNCSCSAACGLCDYYELPEAVGLFRKALIPFGGGLGEGLTCGGVTGALAALSFIESSRGTKAEEVRKKSELFKKKFREEMGTLKCSELVSKDMGKEEKREQCTRAVHQAVLIAQKILS